MSDRGAKVYGGVTIAPFGGSGDVETNLMPVELAGLEALVDNIEVATALVIGAELESLVVAVHYLAGAGTTAGVGAFGSWHDPFGEPMKAAAPPGLELPMFEATSDDTATLDSAVASAFGGASLDLVVDMGTSELRRPDAFRRLVPHMSRGARYVVRRTTPTDTVATRGLADLSPAEVVERVREIPSYAAAAVAFEASSHLDGETSPISEVRLGPSWVSIAFGGSS